MQQYPSKFINFSVDQMRTHPDDIKRWSEQTENPLLKQLALETIEAARK